MRRIPWINLWMIVFGVAAIGLIIVDYRSFVYSDTRFALITALVIQAVIVLIGVLWLPVPILGKEDVKKTPSLSDLAMVYLDACKQLWQRKWLLRLFGIIAALNLMGGLIETIISTHYLAARAAEMGYLKPTPLQHLPHLLASRLPHVTVNSLNWFFPRSGLSTSTGGIMVIAAALLLTLPWLYSRLARLRKEEAYSKDAQFLQSALVSCGIIALAVLAVVPRSFILGLQDIAKGVNRFPDPMYAFVVASSVWMLVQATLNASIVSGTVGLLKQEQEEVTFDSFLKASVRYFKPIAGLYLLMALILYALEIPQIKMMFSKASYHPMQLFAALDTLVTVVTLLLMLVPFAIVGRNLGTWQGIKLGVRQWLANAGRVISLIALGITFLVPILLLESIPNWLIGPTRWFHISLMPFYVAIDTLLVAVMFLAVWEFYRLITEGGAVEQPET